MNTSSNLKTTFDDETVKGGMCKESNSFIWEIENFDAVRETDEQIQRQKFCFIAGKSVDLKTEWEFRLELSKTKNTEKEEEEMWVGCYLYLVKAPVSSVEVFASWQLKIRSFGYGLGRSIFLGSNEAHKYEASKRCGYPRVFPQTPGSDHLPVRNGNLTIELTMQIYAPQVVQLSMNHFGEVASIEDQYNSKFVAKLQEDFAKLLNCPIEGLDAAKIVVSDEVEFDVISSVLSSRSPVFKEVFESETKKVTTKIVRITDISSKTMKVLLSFLYTGKLQHEWRHSDVITELVYAAAKYQLPDLLEFLDEVVGKVCTTKNAGRLMNLTRKCSLKRAEKNLWEFVKKHFTSLDEMIEFTRDADGDISTISAERIEKMLQALIDSFSKNKLDLSKINASGVKSFEIRS